MARLTTNEVITLGRRAQSGDKQAMERLRLENEVLAKRANTRLSSLEKKGMDYYAYDRATHFTATMYERTRFTTSKKILDNGYDLSQQVLELNKFLSSESSTITGQRAIANRRIESFRAKGLNIPKGHEVGFLRFIGSEVIQDAFEESGRSEELIEILSGQELTARNLKSIMRSFNLYMDGKLAYDELIERIDIKNASH